MYLKAPRTIFCLLGEGLGFGGPGLGSHYQGPRALGYIGFLRFQGPHRVSRISGTITVGRRSLALRPPKTIERVYCSA